MSTELVPTVDFRPADERDRTEADWLDSRHSFSFGDHYDPSNTHHGLLLVNNHDVVAPGAGFDTHPHRDMEIVTWVLRGSLVHQDSTGHSGVIYPGLAQRMSAGTGILHSEKNDSWRLLGGDPHPEPVHFVQMWLRPDQAGGTPGYAQRTLPMRDLDHHLVPVASGADRDAAIDLGTREATLWVTRLTSGVVRRLPDADLICLVVARGEVELEGLGRLQTGDTAELFGRGGSTVTGRADAELLIWELGR